MTDITIQTDSLLAEIRALIEDTRRHVAQTANSALTLLHWRLGERISREVLQGQRASYGEEILPTLSAKLVPEYGKGFSARNLARMIRFAEAFPDPQIVASLAQELGWSHFVEILPLKQPLEREFYAEMCRVESWNTRTLQTKIDSMLFERTALSKKPDELIRLELDGLRDEDRLTPDLVFRDPYFLDFLGLTDRYLEKDLEGAILRELEKFLLELGVGFTFVARQKRIQVDNDDYYLDLLFFHRRLKRLVAIELKLGEFKPADKGQMELYLRWLDKYERQPDEKTPIGLILCSGKKQETVKLLALEQSGIRVAKYLTELPPREILAQELHKAIAQAKERIDLQLEHRKEVGP